MATQSATILNAFNDHFMEFVSDIINVFPDNIDLLSAKNSFVLIRKANPKLIVKIWKSYVVDKYGVEIDLGNISFFIDKDYANDLTNAENSDKIIEAINRLRNPVKMMSEESQKKSMKYIQNLKKLCIFYHSL
jgi:accessory colonization factor AcfC